MIWGEERRGRGERRVKESEVDSERDTLEEKGERNRIKKKFNDCVRTVPNLDWYRSSMLNCLAFKTSYVIGFLIFDVSNVKYLFLAFGTPNISALMNFQTEN